MDNINSFNNLLEELNNLIHSFKHEEDVEHKSEISTPKPTGRLLEFKPKNPKRK